MTQEVSFFTHVLIAYLVRNSLRCAHLQVVVKQNFFSIYFDFLKIRTQELYGATLMSTSMTRCRTWKDEGGGGGGGGGLRKSAGSFVAATTNSRYESALHAADDIGIRKLVKHHHTYCL